MISNREINLTPTKTYPLKYLIIDTIKVKLSLNHLKRMKNMIQPLLNVLGLSLV